MVSRGYFVKILVLVLVAILMTFFFVGCIHESSENAENIVEMLTTEQLSSSPPPKPTLSEQEIKNREEYNELMDICERYNDWSAALLIRDMYNKGIVTQNQYAKLYSISAFEGIKDFSEELWSQIQNQLNSASNVLNEKENSMDRDALYAYLSNASQQGTVYIKLLDSQEKQDRMIRSVAYIDRWFDDPTEQNFERVEQDYFADELTPGEIILLSCHMQYHFNRPDKVLREKKMVDAIVFLEERGIMEHAQNALDILYN